MNKEFDKWFSEIDGSHIRAERFWDDVDKNRRRQIYFWMQSAYESGYEYGKKSTQK